MFKNGKMYLFYEGYVERYGNTIRPALVRYTRRPRFVEHNKYIDTVTDMSFYIDGKSPTDTLYGNHNFDGKPYSLALVRPFHSSDKGFTEFNLVGTKFNADSDDDWKCLISESYRLHTLKDPLAYALLAIAFDKFSWNVETVKRVLGSFDNMEMVSILFDMINYLSWSLSPNKIEKNKELNKYFGKECHAVFPPAIEDAAKICNINTENQNIFNIVDLIFKSSEGATFENQTGFFCLINWLNDDDAVLSSQELEEYFPYLNAEKRSLVIKRFFLDVKKGFHNRGEDMLRIFDSRNYDYYSSLRYIFETWPREKDVSTEFLLDCLRTYEKTNEKDFQIGNGILDWAMQKSTQSQRPIELKFYDWLCDCKGGILINKQFEGFYDFELQYELDDFAFEGETLTRNIENIRERYSQMLSHIEEQEVIDKESDKPLIDSKTGKPKARKVTVYDNKWEVLPLSSERVELVEALEAMSGFVDEKKEQNKKYIDLIVNWEKSPEELEDNIFTPEMIDVDIVRPKFEQYLIDKYKTQSPYISERKPDLIVKMFMYPVRMKAVQNDCAKLGESPGVEETVVKERVQNRVIELFGETLECDYDPSIFQLAQTDVQYKAKGESETCFIKSEKTYRGRRKIYCAPALSDFPTLLTGRKCAICAGDMCFVTGIKKDPDWKEYGLIHILEILGYKVIDDTDAGYIPNQVYNRFVHQINKAIRFYKRLVCRECGHVLFPAKKHSYNRYKCLSPDCPECNKEVYLNYCHDCKKGLVDSRDTKQCPNGLYICPKCGSCCSNDFFEYMASRYRRRGEAIPIFLSTKIGTGHYDRRMLFCHKCGAQKVDVHDVHKDAYQRLVGRCPECEPIVEKTDIPIDYDSPF